MQHIESYQVSADPTAGLELTVGGCSLPWLRRWLFRCGNGGSGLVDELGNSDDDGVEFPTAFGRVFPTASDICRPAAGFSPTGLR